MNDGSQMVFGRLLSLAVVWPLLVSTVAIALLLGHLAHEPLLASTLGSHSTCAIAALTAMLLLGAVAVFLVRRALLRVSRDRARALKLARAALGAREEFLVVASHELKTPLTSLRLQLGGALGALRSPHAATPADLSVRLEIADRQAERLACIINGLIDSSRANERTDLVLDDVDLAALARNVAGRLGRTLSRAGCEVALKLPPAGVRGAWDGARVEQALSHLLSNAAKYGCGHPVEIRVDCDTQTARISVRDQGIGIDPDRHAKIFDRFERAVSPRNYGGFGLGLWLARRAVQSLGGTIRVESRPGGGATFTIELPRSGPSHAGGHGLVEQRLRN